MANYIKMPQKIEYLVNYYVLLIKCKDILESPDVPLEISNKKIGRRKYRSLE